MSQIDLKHSTVRFKDGYSVAGTINNVSGYAIGATTMLIAGLPANTVIPVGMTFLMTGDTTVYTVSAHTETSGTTTSVTFSPGLVVATTNNEVITFGPHMLVVHIATGNLTWDENREIQYLLDRGLIDTVREGDQVPMNVTLDFRWDFITAATSTDPPQPEDVLKNINNASDWVTSSPDPCEPFCIDIELEYDPPCSGIKREIMELKMFRWEQLSHDPKAGLISCKGKCNQRYATVTRAA